jgi:ketosteroid isomerase-like protein
MDAFEKYYSEEVVMSENDNPPTVGKAANREREAQFVAYVKEVHRMEVPQILVDGNRAASEWDLEFTAVDGNVVKYHQVAVQDWENGQIVREQFFYNAGH